MMPKKRIWFFHITIEIIKDLRTTSNLQKGQKMKRKKATKIVERSALSFKDTCVHVTENQKKENNIKESGSLLKECRV